MTIPQPVPTEAWAAAERLAEHLTACGIDHFGDDQAPNWTTPAGETFTLDLDAEKLVMVGADGQRYDVAVSVTVLPLRAES